MNIVEQYFLVMLIMEYVSIGMSCVFLLAWVGMLIAERIDDRQRKKSLEEWFKKTERKQNDK